MTLLAYLGLDWPIVAFYLLPPVALALVLCLLRSVVKGRSRLRRAGTLVTMLCIFGIAWTGNISENHTANFEEGILAGFAIAFVLLVDWLVTKAYED
jgi:hypothetical protein